MHCHNDCKSDMDVGVFKWFSRGQRVVHITIQLCKTVCLEYPIKVCLEYLIKRQWLPYLKLISGKKDWKLFSILSALVPDKIIHTLGVQSVQSFKAIGPFWNKIIVGVKFDSNTITRTKKQCRHNHGSFAFKVL